MVGAKERLYVIRTILIDRDVRLAGLNSRDELDTGGINPLIGENLDLLFPITGPLQKNSVSISKRWRDNPLRFLKEF